MYSPCFRQYLADIEIFCPQSLLARRLHFFPSTPSDAANSWNNASSGNVTYRGQLQDVNSLIALMVPGVIGVIDAFRYIKDPYNFEQARNLTNETVSQGSGFVVEVGVQVISLSKERHSLWPIFSSAVFFRLLHHPALVNHLCTAIVFVYYGAPDRRSFETMPVKSSGTGKFATLQTQHVSRIKETHWPYD